MPVTIVVKLAITKIDDIVTRADYNRRDLTNDEIREVLQCFSEIVEKLKRHLEPAAQ